MAVVVILGLPMLARLLVLDAFPLAVMPTSPGAHHRGIRDSSVAIGLLHAGLQLSGHSFVLQMIEFVRLRVLDGVHNNVRIVVFDDTAIFENDASLHSPLCVLGGFHFHLQRMDR